jgi:ketosteroid isomerase-like protein
MSQGNVDLVRSIYPAWERGDFSSAEWAHPEIEYVHADGPAPGTWTGVARMAEAWSDFLSAWEVWRGEAEEYRALDDHRVLVLIHGGGRGKGSGVQVDRMRANGANVFELRDGKVTRLVVYFNRDRALADLGMSEQEARAET